MMKFFIFLTILGFTFSAVIDVGTKDVKIQNNLQIVEGNVEFDSEEIAENFLLNRLAHKKNFANLARLQKDLSNDIEDFLKLIDIEAIVATVFGYLDDPEVVNLIVFILSPEFKELILEFEAMPEFKEAISLLSREGYNPAPIIDIIHDVLSLPPYQNRRIKNRPGISGLIEAIIDDLPVRQLRALFQEKLVTSAQFAELYKTLTSEELEDIVDRMMQNYTFVKAKGMLEELGFDFEYLESVISDILGYDVFMGK